MGTKARTPFHFYTSSHIIKITNQKANTLKEFYDGISQCTDASIFFHTFQSLHDHHFITEGFSNDFAQWISESCEEDKLAEQFAALDIRSYTTIGALRSDLIAICENFFSSPNARAQTLEHDPFYFLESVNVARPTGLSVADLPEFCANLKDVSVHSIHFHFIESRLRLNLRSNDFSIWLAEELNVPDLAEEMNEIDIYTNTLEGIRHHLTNAAYRWLGKYGA